MSNPLVSYLENAKTIKNKFTPLFYLKSASRNLNRKLEDWDIKVAQTNPITPEDMIAQRNMERLNIIKGRKLKIQDKKTRRSCKGSNRGFPS